jgi:hypothetical protein
MTTPLRSTLKSTFPSTWEEFGGGRKSESLRQKALGLSPVDYMTKAD